MAHPLAQLRLHLPWAEKKTTPTPADTPLSDPPMTRWCRETTAALGLSDLSGKVTVRWNPRMRTTVGRAFWPACRIELNPRLNEFPQGETLRTLKHELAHLIAYARSGRRRIAPHGREWQSACTDLGIPGENVRHTLPLTPRKMTRKYSYTCPACMAVFHRVRPIKHPSACSTCCRLHHGGRYHTRFRLIESLRHDP